MGFNATVHCEQDQLDAATQNEPSEYLILVWDHGRLNNLTLSGVNATENGIF